jgi:hypothetical protein
MKDTAYFCPACGSSAVSRSVLAGGAACCDSCKWSGKNEDLHAVPFEHDFSSPEQVMQVFAAEFKSLVGKHLAQPLGAMLLKWGFLDRETLALALPIYLTNAAASMVKSIFETRQKIETGEIKLRKKGAN